MDEAPKDEVITALEEFKQDLREFEKINNNELQNNKEFPRLIARIKSYVDKTPDLKTECDSRVNYYESLATDKDFINLINEIKQDIEILCNLIDTEKAENHKQKIIKESSDKIYSAIEELEDELVKKLLLVNLELIRRSKTLSDLNKNFDELLKRTNDYTENRNLLFDELINRYKDHLLFWNRPYFNSGESIYDINLALDHIINKFSYELKPDEIKHDIELDRAEHLYKQCYSAFEFLCTLKKWGFSTNNSQFEKIKTNIDKNLELLENKTTKLKIPNDLFINEFRSFDGYWFEYNNNQVKTIEIILRELKKAYTKHINKHGKQDIIKTDREILEYKTLNLCPESGLVKHNKLSHPYNKGTDQFKLLKILILSALKNKKVLIKELYTSIYSEDEQIEHSTNCIQPKEKIKKLRDDVHRTLKMTKEYTPETTIKINDDEIYLT